MTNKTKEVSKFINKELMQEFFNYLSNEDEYVMEVAFHVATKEKTGTFGEMFHEGGIISTFVLFLVKEKPEILYDVINTQSVPIIDLLKLGLIKSDIEMFKTH